MTTDSYKVVHRSVKNGNETKRILILRLFNVGKIKANPNST